MTDSVSERAAPPAINVGAVSSVPLVVDLDGTLTPGNTLGEAWLNLLRRSPFAALLGLLWLFRGRAYFKIRLADASPLVVSQLLWNDDLIAWVRSEHAKGRTIVLATGAAKVWAEAAARHLGVFSEVLSTSHGKNLTGRVKRRMLDERFGVTGWDYVGDAAADKKVWAGAAKSYTVDAGRASVRGGVQYIEGTQRRIRGIRVWMRAIRVHQWSKNLLIFAPAILAHRTGILNSLALSAVGFVSFSAIASATYLINNALDLRNDRAHPRKRNRPLASGAISLEQVAAACCILVVISLGLGAWLGSGFLLALIAYTCLTLTYSFFLKQRAAADVMALAALYVLRIVAGSNASGVPLSAWFLAFAVFLFTSLGFAKRATEIAALGANEGPPSGRGYYRSDLGVLVALGGAAAYTAVLVFALYINSPEVRQLYRTPDFLWLAAFAMMGWISRIWLKAHRGELGDDPVAFAIGDRPSLVLGAMCALAVGLAALWR